MDVKEFYTGRLKVSGEKLAGGDQAAFARHVSRNLMRGEAAIQVTAAHFCEQAGDDRRGKYARLQARAEQSLDMIRAAHRELSLIGAELDLLDIPGEGGR